MGIAVKKIKVTTLTFEKARDDHNNKNMRLP